MFKAIAIMFFLSFTLPSYSGNYQTSLPDTPTSFGKAKYLTYNIWNKSGEGTLYCGCDFNPKKKLIDPTACGYKPRKELTKRGNVNQRTKKLEAEHILPAHALGIKREWSKKFLCKNRRGRFFKGRKCGYKIDPYFHAAHNDLYNLAPSIGEINQDRGSKKYSTVGFGDGLKLRAGAKVGNYGQCDIEFTSSIVDPRTESRGVIARAVMYMQDTWGGILGFYLPKSLTFAQVEQRLMFQSWDRENPPTEAELLRNEMIAKIQGKSNRYIDKYITTGVK